MKFRHRAPVAGRVSRPPWTSEPTSARAKSSANWTIATLSSSSTRPAPNWLRPPPRCARRIAHRSRPAAEFDPARVPEVAAAQANYQSAQAQARLAAADAQRYANLVATGDVSRSAYEKARTQQETAEAQANAARQQYEAAVNGARQSYEMISTSRPRSTTSRPTRAGRERPGRHHHSRAIRRLHHRPARGRGRVRGPYQ